MWDSLSLEHGSVEPMRMSFGDVVVVTCLSVFAVSGGVKCGVDADFVLVYTRTVEFAHQPPFTLDFAQKDVKYKTNEMLR